VTRLPVVSGKELVVAFKRLGYEVDHQTGSHIIMRHRREPHRRLVIPNHRAVRKGTLISILKGAGITAHKLKEVL
jgi:predicted RNA binding protein YcfA (HicA-like mRNA interferase family)